MHFALSSELSSVRFSVVMSNNTRTGSVFCNVASVNGNIYLRVCTSFTPINRNAK